MLRQRALSAAVFVPPLVVVLLLGEPWLAALVAVLVLVGAAEAFRLLAQAGYPSIAPLGVVGALVVAGVVAIPDASVTSSAVLLVVAAILVAGAIVALFDLDTRLGLAGWLAMVFGCLYLGQLGFLVRIGQIAPALPAAAPLAWFHADRAWPLLVVLLVWAFDTGAYFVGIRFGRRKVMTHISPSKSWWGIAGGLLAATIVAAIGCWAVGQPPVAGIALGPLVGLAAQFGDLAESMLKRAAGAKDSGSLIPGHGGLLDRIDSFLFAAPVATLYVLAAVR